MDISTGESIHRWNLLLNFYIQSIQTYNLFQNQIIQTHTDFEILILIFVQNKKLKQTWFLIIFILLSVFVI